MDLTFDDEPSELQSVFRPLNKILRAGWLKSGVPPADCETVGQHTMAVIKLVDEHAPSRPDVDPARAHDMAFWHDIAEVETGDYMPGDVTPEQKRSEENAFYAKIRSINAKTGQKIFELCTEYANDDTPTAKFVKDADKLQRLEKANVYRKEYPELDFKRFQRDTDLLRDPKLKKQAHDIVREWRSSDLQDLKCIFVIGPPGVGKGTQCKSVAQQYKNIKHVSAGDLLRSARDDNKSPYHKDAETLLRDLTPASPELITALMYFAVTSGDYNIVLLDGFPYNSVQLAGYREIFPVVSGVINFEAPLDVCMSRLRSRAEGSGRDDDNDATLHKRLEGYEDRGKKIASRLKEENKKTYHEINADQDEGTVASDFQKVLHAILPNEMLRTT
ncbi:hypothetical protein FOVG_18097 [Fusarium oxysporum f. sp. pisi HDV247]|uniref:HD domain-containing protein n=1 Tax=Fusarium oxysporum f. sp. pisi HDV247 TaxID=1080344 RepID=W9NKJ0_FUSOX|nr:hypothetical protein FOVG_18097 [Fusarium oxysporum f. sp. pisi HDV247]EXA30528.1 hypothetical protein FOVG_18097 [Fusarium oxysporum f. sp. pisi HDV247]